MEFYAKAKIKVYYVILVFQFPTGWNSTKTGKAKREKAKRFQLPTGWNSTLPPIKSLGTHTSFNSQRDGILLLTMGSRFAHPRFNSQRDGILQIIVSMFCGAPRRFNSQRDGILLDIAPLLLRCLGAFQFPTGWNSTMMMIKEKRGKCEFQFPTGWNSTQRNPNRYDMEYKVSIPNGMEFYQPLSLRYYKAFLFQFPTGWNSTL